MPNFENILNVLRKYKPQRNSNVKFSKRILNIDSHKSLLCLDIQAQSSKTDNIHSIGKAIQDDLLYYLEIQLPSYDWSKEVKLQQDVNDRADIRGKLSNKCDYKIDDLKDIIIELDNARADQVAKKYVSRKYAIGNNTQSVYVHMLYCTNAKINPSEAYKYLKYCKNLSERNSYIGIILTPEDDIENICVYN